MTRNVHGYSSFSLALGFVAPTLHGVDARNEMVVSFSRGDEDFFHKRIRRGNYFLRNPVHCILVTCGVGESKVPFLPVITYNLNSHQGLLYIM